MFKIWKLTRNSIVHPKWTCLLRTTMSTAIGFIRYVKRCLIGCQWNSRFPNWIVSPDRRRNRHFFRILGHLSFRKFYKCFETNEEASVKFIWLCPVTFLNNIGRPNCWLLHAVHCNVPVYVSRPLSNNLWWHQVIDIFYESQAFL